MALLKSTLFSLFLFSSTLQANESAVREVFDGYGQAMLAKEGEEAFASISSESQDMIGDIRVLSISADKDTLLKQDPSIVLAVLTIRGAADGKVPASNTEAFMLMLSEHYATVLSRTSMGEITIDGDEATGVIVIGDEPTSLYNYFVKENGDWKLDLVTQLAASEEFLPKKTAKEEVGAFYDAVAGQITQRKPGVDPWQPLGE